MISETELTPPKYVEQTDRQILFLLFSVLFTTTAYSTGLSLITTGGFDIETVVNYTVAIVLPIISIPLAQASVISIGSLWEWYFIAFAWIGVFRIYHAATLQMFELLPREEARELAHKSRVGFKSAFVTIFLTGVIASLTGMGIATIGELYFAITFNVFVLPVALSTSLFTFAPVIWVTIAVIWAAQILFYLSIA